jgi:hypothetical protein
MTAVSRFFFPLPGLAASGGSRPPGRRWVSEECLSEEKEKDRVEDEEKAVERYGIIEKRD